MIDLEQDVVVRWNNFTKKWYQEKGYVFTKLKDEFIVKAKDLMPNSTVEVNVTCDYCGKSKTLAYSCYNKSTHNQTEKYACSECGSKKMNETYFKDMRIKQFNCFLELCNKRDHIPLSTIDDYRNNQSKLSFICKKHGEKTITYNDYMNSKTGCVDCGHELSAAAITMSIETVKEIVESKNNDLLKNPQDYVNVNIPNLIVTCGSCGKDFITSLSSIINSGGRCSACGAKYNASLRRLTTEEVIKRINSVNGNILLNPEDYTKNNVINLKVLCACGDIFTTSICNYEAGSNRCPICTQRISKGEILVASILDKLGIEYETEKVYEDCKDKKYLPFDFYLPKYNAIIEFDGAFHFEPVFSEESFIKTQTHDKLKNEYCKQNNIPLLRIPYWESSNAEVMIRNFLKLDKAPKIIHYHKNPYNQ